MRRCPVLFIKNVNLSNESLSPNWREYAKEVYFILLLKVTFVALKRNAAYPEHKAKMETLLRKKKMPHNIRSCCTTLISKKLPYMPPTQYLFLNEKRKPDLAKRVRKQIDKFGLINEELELTNPNMHVG